MNEQIYIPCYGKKLYILFPIVVFDYEPILSVLYDDWGQLYICLCSEIRYLMRWIVSSTNVETIERLIAKEITVNDALCGVSKEAYVIEYSNNEYSFYLSSFDHIDPLYLAAPGTYVEYPEQNVQENFENYKNFATELSKSKGASYFTHRVSTFQNEVYSPFDYLYQQIHSPTEVSHENSITYNIAEISYEPLYYAESAKRDKGCTIYKTDARSSWDDTRYPWAA